MSIACLRRSDKASDSSEAGKATWVGLYRTHWSAVHARCKRLLRDHYAAEDAAQETFVRALPHLESLTDSEHQRRWLFRVASNYCLNQLRDGKRRAELLQAVDPHNSADFASTVLDRVLAERLFRRVPDASRGVAWLV
jgi:RNA polymerase sigma-70 factor, ECF subfamily